ncbi:MAG: hypothetical protein ACK4L7_11365, partial [Flavobacteriales bacterium]
MPGDACDDGNPNTINDVVNAGCVCAGVSVDCTSEAGNDQQICGLTATLQAAGDGYWLPVTGISFSSMTDPEATISAASPGNYTLTWTVAIGTCIDVDTVVIGFLPLSDPAFAYGQSLYCQGDPAPAPWVAQSGGTFLAVPSGLDIDSVTGVINTGTSAPGSYTVAHAISGPCASTATQEITIAPDADASWTPPATVCSDSGPIDLSALVTGTPGGSWQGPGVSSDSFTPQDLSGKIVITYTASVGACMSQSQQIIAVQPAITADAGPDAAVCGLMAALQAQLPAGTGSWTLPAGVEPSSAPDLPDATVQSSSYGTFPMVWTVSLGACSAQDTVWVTFLDTTLGISVDAGPDQHLAATDHATLQGSASPGAQLSWWLLSGLGIIANPSDSITAITQLGVGDNLVVLTASANQCASISDTVLIHVDELFI